MATSSVRGPSSAASGRPGDPWLVSTYCVGVSVLYLVTLVVLIVLNWTLGIDSLLSLGFWFLAVLLSDLMRVRLWDDLAFAMSLPVSLAAAMVLDPWLASLVAFAGSMDLRELRGEIPLARTLFNRAEVGLCILIASAAFHWVGGDTTQWPLVLPAALLAFTLDLSLNVGLVLLPVALLHGADASGVLAKMIGDRPGRTLLVYLSLGIMAPLIALVFQTAGATAVLSFGAALWLAWATFQEGQRAHRVAEQLESKSRAIVNLNEKIGEERKSERLELASALHDEVLPALFRVHLMGQVLKQDLARGRLLDLDEDVAEINVAVDQAQGTMRRFLSGLRSSVIGSAGLETAVRLHAQELEEASDLRFDLEIAVPTASAGAQLLAHQVAKEAMTNAVRHSRGTRVAVTIRQDGGVLRVAVSDDGAGFNLGGVHMEAQFGLGLMRERVEAAGGHLSVDSQLGAGTTIAASLPANL
jgi:signal transduction histidine kinase